MCKKKLYNDSRFPVNFYNYTTVLDDDSKFRIAVHEAGHALVTLKLSPNDLKDVSIVPNSIFPKQAPCYSACTDMSTLKDEENKAIIELSGAVAEKVILGDFLLGSSNDIADVTGAIYSLMFIYGAYGYRYMVYPYTSGFCGIIDESVSKKFESVLLDFEDRARKIIEDNIKVFEVIVDELIKKEKLTPKEINKIYDRVEKQLTEEK